MGNVGSIANMIKKIGCQSKVSNDPLEISNADKLILPGVGAFDKAVNNLKVLNIWDVLHKIGREGQVPLMGICLGMQLLSNSSEEGKEKGLGFINGEVKKFVFDDKLLKVPHMGWNTTEIKRSNKLFSDLPVASRFYFVHSYYLNCIDKDDIITTTNYGQPFVSSIEKKNIIGVQFHPEKSHKFGLQLIKNFIEKY